LSRLARLASSALTLSDSGAGSAASGNEAEEDELGDDDDDDDGGDRPSDDDDDDDDDVSEAGLAVDDFLPNGSMLQPELAIRATRTDETSLVDDMWVFRVVTC
jgi:hypothetical protein